MSKKWKLSRRVEIDAAHYLPDHPGKCKQLHGHRWVIDVEVQTDSLDSHGMVLDFGTISKMVRQFDHECLNELHQFEVMPPTAENMAAWIAEEIQSKLEQSDALVTVTVQETPGSRVAVTSRL